MNRQQRRSQEREQRHSAKVEPKQVAVEQGAAMLMKTVTMNRWDAVNRALGALFDHDDVANLFRLKGLGGATGVISEKALEDIANAAITAGILLPGGENGVENEVGLTVSEGAVTDEKGADSVEEG